MRMALSLSVLLHVLLLGIPMEGDVFGLSGLRFPWEERRLAARDLQIVLAPAAPAAAPAPIPAPPAPSAPVPRKPAAAALPASAPVPPPAAEPPASAPSRGDAIARVAAGPEPEPEPEPDRDAGEQAREVELIALAREQAEREASARVEAERIAARRREEARLEAERLEALQQAQKAEQEAAAQREAARQEAIQQEQARQEQARQEQARQEQARLDQAQREQERASEAQAQASQAAQQGPGDRGPPAQLAPRAERLRAIAEQLSREADGRDRAGSAPGVPPPTVSGQRRGWLFGRSDPNQDLVLYAQAMGRKIELNRTLDMVREAVKQPHTQPVVTVAVRADGSVEKVTFETSSGVPAIDDGIRRIIASQAPYGPFPPALARQYDVVEIRRTWLFDVAVRLQ